MGKDNRMNEEFLASKEFLDYMRKESRKVGAANLKRVANTGKRFYLGELNISNGVMAMGYNLDSTEIQSLLKTYESCDWGERWEDAKINEAAIRSGHGDVIGIYRLDGKEVWIQTDLNEDPQTTIFLPEER